ncbi:LysR substrate-binding domain-containing protein [Kangiella sediminilitoris]|uniref:LysR family transcriptional regulator n=1 Tax=Kangiella sediminilitoris TaxID=1144748 RepID=A0A1B3BDI1_9GAMM|nr:LysR substrate-binding domain-containing protein [Kangiella sediminilitoris]AOE50894.1 LysR family transcriptional regulator [Kangiella sediminilitoris]
MQDLNDLYYFALVVDHEGFAAAERATGIPKSKLSRRVADLEERLGVRLLHRTTRHISVTDIGNLYYQHCQAILIEAQAAEDAIEQTRSEPCGLIRVSCPIALLQISISQIVARFMQQNPNVEIELHATNRAIDLVEEGIDVAIRVRPPPLADSDLVLKVLGQRTQCLVASPDLLSRYETINTPADLTAIPSLGLGAQQHHHQWHLFHHSGEETIISHNPRLRCGDMVALREAAVGAVGIVQLPTLMIEQQLRDQSLVQVLPNWTPRPEIAHAVFPSRRGLMPSIRQFLDYLGNEFRELEQD